MHAQRTVTDSGEHFNITTSFIALQFQVVYIEMARSQYLKKWKFQCQNLEPKLSQTHIILKSWILAVLLFIHFSKVEFFIFVVKTNNQTISLL